MGAVGSVDRQSLWAWFHRQPDLTHAQRRSVYDLMVEHQNSPHCRVVQRVLWALFSTAGVTAAQMHIIASMLVADEVLADNVRVLGTNSGDVCIAARRRRDPSEGER